MTQRIHVGRHRLHLLVADCASTLGRHRDSLLRLLGGYPRGDGGDDRVVRAVAVEPLRIGQIGPDRALGVAAVTGVAQPGLVEDRVALGDRGGGDTGAAPVSPALRPLQRRPARPRRSTVRDECGNPSCSPESKGTELNPRRGQLRISSQEARSSTSKSLPGGHIDDSPGVGSNGRLERGGVSSSLVGDFRTAPSPWRRRRSRAGRFPDRRRCAGSRAPTNRDPTPPRRGSAPAPSPAYSAAAPG